MIESSIREALCIIDLFVEADNGRDIVFAEVGKVGFWGVKRIAIVKFAFGVRTAKSNECVGKDPIQIPVLYSLVMFILVYIKSVKIEETIGKGFAQTPEAIDETQIVSRRTEGSIS